MIIVSADTSTQAGSVALRKNTDQILERPLAAGRPHSETLLPAIDALLSGCGVNRADVTGLAVGTGPGAFTGLRVGLATFKGWATAAGLKLAPIPSLDAVAFPLLKKGRRVLVCSDARKGELYTAFYPGLDGDSLPRSDGEAVLIKPSALPDFCRQKSVGDSAVIGTGLDLVLDIIKDIRGLKPSGESGSYPSASAILSLGEKTLLLGRGIEPSALTPYYVRRPDVVYPSRVP